MDGYLMISASAFATMSKGTQAEVLKAGLQYNEATVSIPVGTKDDHSDDLPPFPEELVSLTEYQCRSLIASPMHDKTYRVVQTIAEELTPTFDLADLAGKIGVSVQDLKGPLSGLTQRTRAVTKRKSAVFVDQYGEKRRDKNGVCTGQAVRLRPKTHASLKAIFKFLKSAS